MIFKRDTFRDQHYWDHHVAYLESTIQEDIVRRDDPMVGIVNRFMLLYDLYRAQLQLLISRYSRGEDIGMIQQSLSDLLEAYVLYSREPGFEPFLLNEMSDYVQVLWLLSLPLLLKADHGVVRELVNILNVAGQDALVDRLIAAHDLLNGSSSTALLHPRPYEYLMSALETQEDQQQQAIQQFLQRYYRSLRHTYWYDRHLRPDTGFFGYWCFELAACVIAFGISDQTFSDNIYYPRDLVTWRKACRTS